MKYFYSPETGGFYIEGVSSYIPDDAFEVSEAKYRMLLDGQSSGKEIKFVNSSLMLVEPSAPEKTWDEIRSIRNRLLVDSDWTQMPDSPLSSSEVFLWKRYRQSLRDITETYTDPSLVIWPNPPK